MEIHGVGTQLYVWSQVYGREGKPLEAHLDAAFSEVAGAGYDGLETNLAFLKDEASTERFKALLDKHGLKAPSLYHGGIYHDRAKAEATVAETVALAERTREIGCQMINVNPSPKGGGAEKTDEELLIQTEYINRLGEALHQHGLQLVLHNHTPEIVNDARELRANCAYTDARYVNLCLDTHWAWRGGMNPFELMTAYRNRIRSLHIRNSVKGIWSEALGEGDIDHAAMRDLLASIDYKGWLYVELAYEEKTVVTRTLAENARLSREYVRAIFGI